MNCWSSHAAVNPHELRSLTERSSPRHLYPALRMLDRHWLKKQRKTTYCRSATRDERLFRRHLLKVVFSDDVDGFQEHITGRRFEPTYPQFEMTRRDFESVGEFFGAAGDFGGPLERPCVNRWQLSPTSRGGLSSLPHSAKFATAQCAQCAVMSTQRLQTNGIKGFQGFGTALAPQFRSGRPRGLSQPTTTVNDTPRRGWPSTGGYLTALHPARLRPRACAGGAASAEERIHRRRPLCAQRGRQDAEFALTARAASRRHRDQRGTPIEIGDGPNCEFPFALSSRAD